MEDKLLSRYTSDFDRGEGHYDDIDLPQSAWAYLCRLKDRTNALLDRRVKAAREVIDVVAKRVGIDPETSGLYLYAPDLDGSSPIVAKMDEYFSRSGEKATLKKRIDELENENRILRSLLGK